MTNASPHRIPLLGWAFLAYALGCLFLTYSLSNLNLEPAEPEFAQLSPQKRPDFNSNPAPDFSAIVDIKQKKRVFFEFLLPSIQKQNDYYLAQRQWLLEQQQKLQFGYPINQSALQQLSKRYRISASDAAELIEQLLLHLDTIPAALILAQAANESAWGTSRFAREANNYFGQWCFTEGCGVIPNQRSEGASHEVKRFTSADASVAAYFLNINRNQSYQSLRAIRAEMRRSQQPLDSLKLAEGLTLYSSRGEAYTHELQAMIRYNRLQQYDRPL